MLPQMIVSLGPRVALSGMTQRPVLLLCGTEHSSDMLWSYSLSVLSLPVVSTVLLPACRGGPISVLAWPVQTHTSHPVECTWQTSRVTASELFDRFMVHFTAYIADVAVP